MRAATNPQLSFIPSLSKTDRLAELEEIDKVLDANSQIVQLLYADMVRGINPSRGRSGFAAEQILRALILKQTYDYTYDDLEFHLNDSPTYRWFCRLDCAQHPNRASLQRNIKKVAAETLEAISCQVVRYALEQGIETLRKVRTDCTTVETTIHKPSDSSLLLDCVRVLDRLLAAARDTSAQILFQNHTRRATKRAIAIEYARSKKQREPLYRDLLKVTSWTVDYAERAIPMLIEDESGKAKKLAGSLEHFVDLAKRVVKQTRRRVLEGESVPVAEKVVSIFEPHTDIIVKDRRQTLFGHKLCLTAGASGLILDAVILDGNPADSTLAVNMIKRLQGAYSRVPRQVTFDGGFASNENIKALKELGVGDVVFAKSRGITIDQMAKSEWVYKRLRNFRAGIEGTISFLKRFFALDRCTWRSMDSFRSYVWSSLLSANLLVVARHQLQQKSRKSP